MWPSWAAASNGVKPASPFTSTLAPCGSSSTTLLALPLNAASHNASSILISPFLKSTILEICNLLIFGPIVFYIVNGRGPVLVEGERLSKISSCGSCNALLGRCWEVSKVLSSLQSIVSHCHSANLLLSLSWDDEKHRLVGVCWALSHVRRPRAAFTGQHISMSYQSKCWHLNDSIFSDTQDTK